MTDTTTEAVERLCFVLNATGATAIAVEQAPATLRALAAERDALREALDEVTDGVTGFKSEYFGKAPAGCDDDAWAFYNEAASYLDAIVSDARAAISTGEKP